jgi:hypothetical protein
MTSEPTPEKDDQRTWIVLYLPGSEAEVFLELMDERGCDYAFLEDDTSGLRAVSAPEESWRTAIRWFADGSETTEALVLVALCLVNRAGEGERSHLRRTS